MPVWIVTATKTVTSGFVGTIGSIFSFLFTFSWDSGLTFLNLITPKRRKIEVVWPEFVPRKDTDSRSPCPFINTLANHGILPHDGRNITFKELGRTVKQYYNVSSSLSYFTCNNLADTLKRNYTTDRFDLSDMCVHNGIEHDGSITRQDVAFQPDQSYPDEKLIRDFIASCQNDKKLTAADCSRFLTKRFMDSKRNNGQFSLTTFHYMFGAMNTALLLLICGGDLDDIRTFLLEERAPEGWSSKMRKRFGLTMASFNHTSLGILLGIDPAWKKVQRTS